MLRIPIVHAHDVSKQIPREKKISIGLKCYKEGIIMAIAQEAIIMAIAQEAIIMAIAQEAIIFIYVIYLPFIYKCISPAKT